MDSLHPSTRRRVVRLVTEWGRLWSVSSLETQLSVTMNPRLTRSLGRCNPVTGRISLREGLPSRQLPAVLCHEVAHLAAHRLYGTRITPHGSEWADLVRTAGFVPSSREFTDCLPAQHTPVTPYHHFRYAHRCTVCQSVRWAQRRMMRWRCQECVESGLPGEMIITDCQQQT